MSMSVEMLWDNLCRLRLKSKAHRAVDDPVVASAYQDWEEAFLANEESRESAMVIPFPDIKGVQNGR